MRETELRLKIYPDPLLRKRVIPVKEITAGHRQLLSQMARIMYENSGIGLAAPQIGIREAMMVIDIGSGLYKLVNPRIIKKQGRQVMEEGCLSVPGVCVKVKRAKKVLVAAQDENGKGLNIEAEDLLACVLQHEIDHLRGKLIPDYASFWDRMRINKQLEALKRKSNDERLSASEAKSCRLQL